MVLFQMWTCASMIRDNTVGRSTEVDGNNGYQDGVENYEISLVPT